MWDLAYGGGYDHKGEIMATKSAKKTEVKQSEPGIQKPKILKSHGKKYEAVIQLLPTESVVSGEVYEVLEKSKVTSFDPTVEIHINVTVTGIRGNITLPGGAVKIKKVLIIDENNFDDEVKKIESGKVGFDILITKPEMMPRMAKYAKVLGPRGLMPNPKSGTVTEHPEKVRDEISGGKVEYKQDKSNIIHLAIGKLSFGKERIENNIKEILGAMPNNKIKSAYVNLTMGPSIALDVSKKLK